MLSKERFAANQRALLQAKDSIRQLGGLLNSFTTNSWADELAAIPGAEGPRQKLLQNIVNYFEQYESLAAHDPSFAADAALARSKLGSIYEKMGKRSQALDAHKTATSEWEASSTAIRSMSNSLATWLCR